MRDVSEDTGTELRQSDMKKPKQPLIPVEKLNESSHKRSVTDIHGSSIGNKELEGIRGLSRSALDVEVPETTNSAINIGVKHELNIVDES